jgi:hypothetical protein
VHSAFERSFFRVYINSVLKQYSNNLEVPPVSASC